MRRQTEYFFLFTFVLICSLSIASNGYAESRGAAADLTDETAYIDQRTGAKGWYLGEDGRPTTQEAFMARVEASHAAIQARANAQVDFIQSQAEELSISDQTVNDMKSNTNQMKADQNNQVAEMKVDGANLKPMPRFQKALVSKENQ